MGVIEAHDRESFETFCYSDVSGGDIFTTRFESSADQWRDIRRLTNEEVADEIRADRIDILVELTGDTSENRLMVMARRPAPIQVSYIGYPNTTGMEQIDYRITDARADPPGSGDELYSETLVRLPSGFLCYRPWVNETTVSEPPSLTRGHVTFGSFNNTVKVTADVIKTWARILLALPGSRLVLKAMQLADDEARMLMLKRCESYGVTKERIELHGGFIPRDDHLNVYANVDVGLDPFPYNGATTTCEALSMGVPVICLDGDTHRARVGVSLLSEVGLTELIADTVDDYVRLAVDLARDPHYLTELRASLRNRLGSSPLMDAHATTKELEKAYRTMWRTYCQQPVESNSDREDSDFLRLHIGGSEPKPGWKI